MNYKIKWIEENLGITRNMIRRYEKEGLLPENKEGRDRAFTQEDLMKLWHIRIFVKMGFSLSEIKELIHEGSLSKLAFDQKMKELEKEREMIEEQINFMKVIDATGKIPSAFDQRTKPFETIYQLACQQYKNPIQRNKESFWKNVEEVLWLHKILQSEDKEVVLEQMYSWFQSNTVDCTKEIFAEIFASHIEDVIFLTLYKEDGCQILKEAFLRFGKVERRDSK